MKLLLISAVMLVSISPLAFCCVNTTLVTAIVSNGKSIPVTQHKQRQSEIDSDKDKPRKFDALTASGVDNALCTTAASRPSYPSLAKKARIQGQVILEATIDESGKVTNLKLISGHPMLVEAAMEAVKQWKYKPYLVKGKPAQVKTTIDVNFRLSGN